MACRLKTRHKDHMEVYFSKQVLKITFLCTLKRYLALFPGLTVDNMTSAEGEYVFVNQKADE
jgi:hypothetical protein